MPIFSKNHTEAKKSMVQYGKSMVQYGEQTLSGLEIHSKTILFGVFFGGVYPTPQIFFSKNAKTPVLKKRYGFYSKIGSIQVIVCNTAPYRTVWLEPKGLQKALNVVAGFLAPYQTILNHTTSLT